MFTPAVVEALGVILRYLITAALGQFVTYGLFKASDVADLVGPVTTVASAAIGIAATAGYALWRSRKAAKIADVAAMPDVSTVHVDPKLAAAVQIPNVVATPPAAP